MTALLLVSVLSHNPPAPQWSQDTFAISFWVDPMVPSSEFDKEYAVIADANFSVLLGGFGATDVPTVELQIAAAQKHGLAVIPSYCKGDCVNITTGGSDLWGFQVADEPRMPNFDELAPAVAAVKAQGKLAFVNLLPNYAGPSEFAAGTYGEYVSTFISKVKPNLVSVDHYPDFDPSPDQVRTNKTKQGYIDNLLVLRDLTLKAGYPLNFWNFFNAMPYNKESQYDISEAELRWQVYTSLAIGSKGVLYFCYWTPPGNDFLRGQAIMVPKPGHMPADTAVQVPGSKYPMVKRINSKLNVFGNYLLKSSSTAVVQANGTQSTTTTIEAGPISSINGTATGPDWQFLLGFFDQNKTMMLVNLDSNHPALASLSFSSESVRGDESRSRSQGSGGVMMEVDPSTGAAAPALDDSPFLAGFQVSLLAGDARLFTWR